MEAASAGDQLVARSKVEVIGVPEDDLGPDFVEMTSGERLDRALRADRHESRGLDDAVRGGEVAAARQAVGVGQGEE